MMLGARLTLTLTLLLVVVTCVWRVRGQTNNTENQDGTITWGQLAPDKPYKTMDYTADDGGLDPYYALAVSFIDSSLPEKLPVDTVKDILDGKTSIGDSWQDLAKQFAGFATCVVIGLLFFFIFPIVAICFCCCRCCGNCGGKRIHHQGPNDKCKRIGFAIALTILSLFVITGAACVFVTSDQLHKNLDGLNDSVTDAVNDMNTFADNIDQQFRRLGDTNFQFLIGVLAHYVDNAAPKLSEDITKIINNDVNLDGPLDHISQLSDQALAEINNLETQVNTLDTQRHDAKSQLQAVPCTNCLSAQITFLENLNLTPLSDQITTFKDEVSTDVFEEMKTNLSNAIEAEVKDGTKDINVTKQLNDVHKDQIQGMLDQVTDFKTDLNDKLTDVQEKEEKWVEDLKPYDTYRWYAGVGLASLLTLIAVMLLLGVLLGTCCGSSHVRPTERGAASNCGGIFLMASVGLVFIFGALLMLLCTLMYMAGSLTERYVCQSVDHLDRLEEYAKSFDFDTDLSNYTFHVNDETLYLSLNDVMNDCKEDKTLYTALGLQGVVDTALKEIEDYKNTLDDFSKIDFGKAATDANQVNVDSAVADLQNTVDTIATIQQDIETMRTDIKGQRADAETAHTGAGQYYDPMILTLDAMVSTCSALSTTTAQIKTAATNMQSSELADATNKLSNATYMKALIEHVTDGFKNGIFAFVDSYVDDMRLKLKDDVGKCVPMYSIFHAILGEATCHGIVDALNGFWLALGWSLFFLMPSIILAVKLAKHYRTMLYEETYDTTTGSPPPAYYTETSGAAPKSTLFPPITGPNNKVAPF